MPQTAIDRFAAGADTLHSLVRGLSSDDLNAHPVPGTWSLQELVLHLLDSDLVAAHRMKRIIAEEKPLLIAYDESAFVRSLGYGRLSLPLACDLFRLNRLHTAELLRLQPAAAFARTGVHNQRGTVSLLDLVKSYADHLDHHLAFAREKCRALGRVCPV